MRRLYMPGRTSPENHSLISRVSDNIIFVMKRLYSCRALTLVCTCMAVVLAVVLAVPSQINAPIIVTQEIERVMGEMGQTTDNESEDDAEKPPVDFASCSGNPEEEMTTLEIIRKSEYPAEEHLVTTQDGYILALHRIPGVEGSPAVLLHHALLESSFCWVVSGKKRGLAYILADAGYDVWMGNARGNTYSKKHTNLSTSDPEFWNFTWHEMGIYDVPAEIEYITSLKNDSLMYIGHSMGTTMFFVMASERPDIASKVKAMFGLAPVAFTNNLKGPFKLLGTFMNNIQKYKHFDGLSEFFAQNAAFKFTAKCICSRPIFKQICRTIVFSVVGFNEKQFNTTMLPLILTHTPAGSSLKTILHFAQGIQSKKFLQYDYGQDINEEIYKSKHPPEYDFSKIQVPIVFFWGQNDFLAQPKDVTRLYDNLPRKINMYKVNDPDFNHLDFLWGLDAPELVYAKLLLLMEKYRRPNELST